MEDEYLVNYSRTLRTPTVATAVQGSVAGAITIAMAGTDAGLCPAVESMAVAAEAAFDWIEADACGLQM